jgi:hypothetical protein
MDCAGAAFVISPEDAIALIALLALAFAFGIGLALGG